MPACSRFLRKTPSPKQCGRQNLATASLPAYRCSRYHGVLVVPLAPIPPTPPDAPALASSLTQLQKRTNANTLQVQAQLQATNRLVLYSWLSCSFQIRRDVSAEASLNAVAWKFRLAEVAVSKLRQVPEEPCRGATTGPEASALTLAASASALARFSPASVGTSQPQMRQGPRPAGPTMPLWPRILENSYAPVRYACESGKLLLHPIQIVFRVQTNAFELYACMIHFSSFVAPKHLEKISSSAPAVAMLPA